MSDQPKRLVDDPNSEVGRLLRRVETAEPTTFARARVWARLAEPSPAPSRKWLVAVAGAAALVLLFLLLPPRTESPIRILENPSQVTVAKRVEGSRAHVVRTKGRATIDVDQLAVLELAPSTELVLFTGETPRIELLSGELVTQPVASDRAVVVSTRPFVITGARMRVVRHGDQLSIEAIDPARVEGPSGETALGAGERFDDPPQRAAVDAVEDVVPPEEAPVRREAPVVKPKPRARRPKARRRARRAKVEAKAPPAEAVREDPVEEAPQPKPAVPPEAPVRRDEPGSAPRSDDVTPEIPTEPDWGALYRQATMELNAPRAILLFDRVAKSGSPWAEVSAHQAARLEMRRGRCGAAIPRFERLLGGTFDHEARLDVLECQLRMGKLGPAQRTLEAFLARHPKSARSPEMRFLRGELLRKQGRCVQAISDYEASSDSGRSDDALYFAAWCRLEIGRTAEGLSSLETYLERHPNGRHAGEARRALKKTKKE